MRTSRRPVSQPVTRLVAVAVVLAATGPVAADAPAPAAVANAVCPVSRRPVVAAPATACPNSDCSSKSMRVPTNGLKNGDRSYTFTVPLTTRPG